jgi:hypothetical protein
MKPFPTELLNLGFLRVRDASATETATIIIVGIPRSGTSMVASVLKTLGLFIGKEIDGAVFEDREIAAAIDSGKLARFAAIAEARNAEHRMWGFKRPEAYKQLAKLCSVCRNPRVIVPFRDMLAIALRNKIAMQMDAPEQLPRLAAQYDALTTAVFRAAAPALLLSYEKSLQFPSETVTEIASFCGIQADRETIGKAAETIKNGEARYLRSARLRPLK